MELDDNVLLAWGIFLALAYVLTVALLPTLFGVIHAANRIARASSRTLPAAAGIVRNTAAIERLAATGETGGAILNTAQGLVAGAASIESRLESLAGGPR